MLELMKSMEMICLLQDLKYLPRPALGPARTRVSLCFRNIGSRRPRIRASCKTKYVSPACCAPVVN